ncbi:MAG: glycerophosphodiester phosphodiesterase [Verrucomicrobia bacterium]|nr:glycerophosphodiester phosphodiesterase [Verrucomicrobiota bacterium]
MELIAHRGASHEAPENTLAAFDLAWCESADAAECDVHLTCDGEVVVIHDEDTRRTTGARGKVSERTLAELQKLDAGSWKSRRFVGEHIPTLAQVLDTIPRGKRLFIEIKSGPQTVAPLAATLKRSRVKPEQVAIIGFALPVMQLAKRALPRVPVYLGAESSLRLLKRAWPISPAKLIQATLDAGLDGLDVDARGPIDSEFVERVHAAHLKLFVWTVNNAALARRLVTAGVDGITTNRPAWLREKLSRA